MAQTLPAGKCLHCGSAVPERRIEDDEVCECSSRMCLLRSAQICVTTNLPRRGTMRIGAEPVTAKAEQEPKQDRMVRSKELVRK